LCNDRSLAEHWSGWNPDGGIIKGTYSDFYFVTYRRSDLSCKNKNDRFTVSEANGNGVLIYPVGLITSGELSMMGRGSDVIWTMTPQGLYYNPNLKLSFARVYSSNFRTENSVVDVKKNVKPTISLRPGIIYSVGDGSVSNPYVIDLDVNNDKFKISYEESDQFSVSLTEAYNKQTVSLESKVEKYKIASFKVNNRLVKGNSFAMPAHDVVITDVKLEINNILESDHFPYLRDIEEKEVTFEGATSLSVVLDYQTADNEEDFIHIYDADGKEYGRYNSIERKNENIRVEGNYVKIIFEKRNGSNYYGYKATVTPNYE